MCNVPHIKQRFTREYRAGNEMQQTKLCVDLAICRDQPLRDKARTKPNQHSSKSAEI